MPSAQQNGQRDLPGKSARVLDYSGRGVRRIDCFPEDWSPVILLLNSNDISKIENLQYMAHLQELYLADNNLEEMRGIGQAQGLRVLDLSNNSIVSVEDLGQLRVLQWLSLSGNEIKHIENLSRNTQLTHLDLSDNNIEVLSDMTDLTNLKTLLLHGNLISSLKYVGRCFPASVITLSLAGNEISDLNEMLFLSYLSKLEQLSVANNTCVIMDPPSFGFDYRPYLLFCCPKLRSLDCQRVSQAERFRSDHMSRTGRVRLFSPGSHTQLVAFLSHACPLPPAGQQTDTDALWERSGDRGTGTHDRPPTATQGSASGYDARSAPVQDLTPDDVTSDDDIADQLRSDSRYLPVFCPSPPTHRKNVDTRPYTAPPQRNAERDLAPRPATAAAGGRSQCYPVASGSVERSEHAQDPNDSLPIMTEQEALRLFSLAASIIQAHVRGFLVRRRLNFWEYKKRNRAAALIQATWRGYHARTYNIKVISIRNDIRARRFQSYLKQLSITLHRLQDKNAKDAQLLMEAIKSLYEELKNVKEVNQKTLLRERTLAALKIQSFWRGYVTRKEYALAKVRSSDRYQALLMFCRRLQQQVNFLTDYVQGMERDQKETHSRPKASELTADQDKASSDDAESLKDNALKHEGEEGPDKEGVEGSTVHNQADPAGNNPERPTNVEEDQVCSTSERPGDDNAEREEPGDDSTERRGPGGDSAEQEGPGDDSVEREGPGDDSVEHEDPGEEHSAGYLFHVDVVNLPEILISSPITTDEGRSASGSLSDLDDFLESSQLPCHSGKIDQNPAVSEETNTSEGPVPQQCESADNTQAISGKSETAESEPAGVPDISDFNSKNDGNDAFSSSAAAHSTEVSLDLNTAQDALVEEDPADVEDATTMDEPEESLNFIVTRGQNSIVERDQARLEDARAKDEFEESSGLGSVNLEPSAEEEELRDVEEAKGLDEEEESGGSSLESTLKASDSVPESELSAKEREPDSEQGGDVASPDELEDLQSGESSGGDDEVDPSMLTDASDDVQDQAHSSEETASHLEENIEEDVSNQASDEEEIPASRPFQDTSDEQPLSSKGHALISKKSDLDFKEHVSASKENDESASRERVLARGRSEDVLFSSTVSRCTSHEGQPTRSYFPLRHSSSLGPKASSIFSELRSEIAALKAKHKAGVQASAAWTKQVERELEPAASLSSALDKFPGRTVRESSALENDDDNDNQKASSLENKGTSDSVLVEKNAEKLDSKHCFKAENSSEESDNVLVVASAIVDNSHVPSDFDESFGVADNEEAAQVESSTNAKRGLPLFEDIEKSSFSAEDYFTDK